MVHGLQHGFEGVAVAAHLQAHVEALGHVQLLHHLGQALLGGVHGQGRPHLAGQFQPVLVHVRDDHVPGAHVPGDGHGHDADGAGAGDQDVLPHHVEAEGCVGGVAVGVEDGGRLVRDVVGHLEHVEGRKAEILREGTRAVDPHPHRVATEVALPGTAVPAVAAGDVAFSADAVARVVALHLGTHLLDNTVVLMAHHHGHGNGLLGPGVPVVDMDVRPADGTLVHPDQHIVRTHLGHGDLPHPDPFLTLGLQQGFHERLQRLHFTTPWNRGPSRLISV